MCILHFSLSRSSSQGKPRHHRHMQHSLRLPECHWCRSQGWATCSSQARPLIKNNLTKIFHFSHNTNTNLQFPQHTKESDPSHIPAWPTWHIWVGGHPPGPGSWLKQHRLLESLPKYKQIMNWSNTVNLYLGQHKQAAVLTSSSSRNKWDKQTIYYIFIHAWFYVRIDNPPARVHFSNWKNTTYNQ